MEYYKRGLHLSMEPFKIGLTLGSSNPLAQTIRGVLQKYNEWQSQLSSFQLFKQREDYKSQKEIEKLEAKALLELQKLSRLQAFKRAEASQRILAKLREHKFKSKLNKYETYRTPEGKLGLRKKAIVPAETNTRPPVDDGVKIDL